VLIATQRNSGTLNNSVTLALLSGKTHIVKIRFPIPILASLSLDFVAAPALQAYVERAFSVFNDTSM